MGKTTALKVIADLVRPSSGRMTYWQGLQLAYVSQDEKIFSRTIRENVSYGAPGSVSDTAVWEALRKANLREFVESLPRGLDEELLDGELCLSGGQLQRLNLAHLFCACKDADLVILDEVLSALDPDTREYLLDELKIFLQNKTAILITHHTEMIRICDHVHHMTPPKRLSVIFSPKSERKPMEIEIVVSIFLVTTRAVTIY